jgi:hypothetical protein
MRVHVVISKQPEIEAAEGGGARRKPNDSERDQLFPCEHLDPPRL